MKLVAILLVALLGVPAVVTAEPTQAELETALTCQCGCGLTVHSCNHLQCPSGEPMKDEIRRRLGEGEAKETILAAFAAKYGEKVLSSPTMQGFNWFAWITPFAAVFMAGAVLVFVVRRRVGESLEVAGAPPPSDDLGDPALRERLARELDDLDRTS